MNAVAISARLSIFLSRRLIARLAFSYLPITLHWRMFLARFLNFLSLEFYESVLSAIVPLTSKTSFRRPRNSPRCVYLRVILFPVKIIFISATPMFFFLPSYETEVSFASITSITSMSQTIASCWNDMHYRFFVKRYTITSYEPRNVHSGKLAPASREVSL